MDFTQSMNLYAEEHTDLKFVWVLKDSEKNLTEKHS